MVGSRPSGLLSWAPNPMADHAGMETTGVPGCVQVTERTRELSGERYVFRQRGRIQVKGKGKMLTYYQS